MSWLPIETAPKDETAVLLYGPDFELGCIVAFWSDGWSDGTPEPGWSTSEALSPIYDKPTHWMPLPSAPGAATVPTDRIDGEDANGKYTLIGSTRYYHLTHHGAVVFKDVATCTPGPSLPAPGGPMNLFSKLRALWDRIEAWFAPALETHRKSEGRGKDDKRVNPW